MVRVPMCSEYAIGTRETAALITQTPCGEEYTPLDDQRSVVGHDTKMRLLFAIAVRYHCNVMCL